MESAPGDSNVRPLASGDLDRIVAIDRVHSGHARRHFFEKRLGMAQDCPDDFIHIGVVAGDTLQGFAIARILRGEFGQRDVIAVLEVLGIDPESRRRGLGRTLMRGLLDTARRLAVSSVQSQVNWTNPDLLRFFNASGFELAPRLALERAVGDLIEETDGEP